MKNPIYRIQIIPTFSQPESLKKFHRWLLNETLRLQRNCQVQSEDDGHAIVTIQIVDPIPGFEKRCAECRAGRQPASHTLACPANSLTDEDLIYPD